MRKQTNIIVAAAIAAHVLSVTADTSSTWKSAVSGDWNAPGNWTSNAALGYPNGEYDNFEQPASGTYTITLNDDVQVGLLDFGWINGIHTVDLNGNTLSVRKYAYDFKLNCGSSPTASGSAAYTTGVLFKNGSLEFEDMMLGTQFSDSCAAVLDFSGVTLSGFVRAWNGGTRIIVRDGSMWTVTGKTIIQSNVYRPTMKYPCLIVTGEGTSVAAGSNSLEIRGFGGGLFLKDGASASYGSVAVGGNVQASNVVCQVEDAALSVSGDLTIGGDEGEGSTLRICGTHAKVAVGGALVICRKTTSILDLTVPKTGFADAESTAQVPLTAGSLSVRSRNGTTGDAGETVFKVTSRDWCNYHSLGTLTLMSFSEPLSDDAATELLGNVQLTDYTDEEVAAGQAPIVEVGADGRSIVLTAPEVQADPDIVARAQYGTTVGTKKFIVWINGFGAVSSAITSLKLVWSESEDYSVPTEKELLEGGATIVGPLPKVQTYSVAGDFVAHRKYYAKVTATTDEGFASTVAFAFEGDDGVAETLRWHVQADGDWHGASNWYRKEGGSWVPAGEYPHGDDTLSFAAWDYAITFSDDAEALAFPGDVNWPGMCYGTKTFELNGHTFRITALSTENRDALTIGDQNDTDAKAKDDLEIIAPTVVFKNGRFEMPGRADSPTLTCPDIAIGAMTRQGSGSLVLDNHANVVADIRYINNSSRFFVKGGSVWRPVSIRYCMNTHTARTPYSLVSVEGTGSQIDLGSYDMIVRGSFAGLYLSDGGRIDAQNLIVGSYGTVYGTGATLASDRTQVKIDNGTVVTKANLELGWTADEKLNPWLVIGGKTSTVTVGGSLKIHEGLAAKLEFDLPEEGYDAVPLVAGSLSLEDLPAGNADRGDAVLSLKNVRRWMRQHYEQSMTLVRLATPNAAALELLKSRVASDCPRVGADNLQVIDGGRELVLTAPERLGLTVILR